MAIKTFTTGEVLTAADTNTYLANSGLVYITQATLTSTAINIVGCFSATYDSYKFVFTNARLGAAAQIQFQMLNGSTPVTTATYNYTRWGYNGAVVNTSTAGATFGSFGFYDSNTSNGSAEVFSPFLAKTTGAISANVYGGNSNLAYPETNYTQNTNGTSYDGIRLIAGGSTFFEGTVRVYGYRQS